MSESEQSAAPADEELSALLDGEAGASAVARACRLWRQDETQRAQWHAYHLIGDVLRNEDLARPAQHDEAFLHAFRARLALEPVVLAPSATSEPATALADHPGETGVLVDFPGGGRHLPSQAKAHAARRSMLRRWSAPIGVAAGVALVSGVVWLNRAADPSLASERMAQGAASAPMMVQDPRAIEDAQLARYFSAHKQFSGTPVDSGLAPSTLRNATYQQPIAVGR